MLCKIVFITFTCSLVCIIHTLLYSVQMLILMMHRSQKHGVMGSTDPHFFE